MSVFATAALVAVLPVISQAQENNTPVNADASVNASIQDTPPANSGQPLPPPGPSGTIRAKLRSDYDTRLQNLKNNQEYRNDIIQERRGIATSTHAEIRNIRAEDRPGIKGATSTEERRDLRKDMRFDIFNARKQAVIGQLTISLNNLKEIRTRISSRIDKESQAGRNMTSAKAALVTADAKIVIAQNAINALSSISATSTIGTTATTTASTTIDLMRPRQSAQTAIMALKDARGSLNQVVVAIAHSMGLKLGVEATTTASTGNHDSDDNDATSTSGN